MNLEPDWKEEVTKRLATLNLAPTREAEFVEELAQHIEDRYRELLSDGISQADARQIALAELGESHLLSQQIRRIAGTEYSEPVTLGSEGKNILANLRQDLRYAARVLRKHRGFTLVTTLTLALGIGVNTAIFSLANALLFRNPEGIRHPEEVVLLGGTLNGSDFNTFSYPDYVDYRNQNASFVDLAAYRQTALYLTTEGSAQTLSGKLVSGNYFMTLGTHADLGRTLMPEDDAGTPGANAVAMISHRLWERQFGSNRNIVGRVINLNNFSFTIVGVAQRDFRGTGVGETTDVWLPLTMYSQADPLFHEKRLEARHISWLSVLGRLKTGVSIQQAQENLTNLARRLEQTYPDTNKGMGIAIAPGIGLRPQTRNEARTTMRILLIIAGLVLLIACANVANLFLAKGAARSKEIVVRVALGASRARVVRQLLTEAFLISIIGGLLGVTLAFWSRSLLLSSDLLTGVRLSPQDLRFDGRVLGFGLVISLATGFIFGVIPALEASNPNLQSMLKERVESSLQRARFRGALVVGQIALSVVVLICAGLFVRTLKNAQSIQPGFDADKIVAVPIELGRRGYSEEQGRLFYQQVVERVRALPGVSAASLSVTLPLSGTWRTGFHVEGQPPVERETQCDYNIIAPRYFETMGIPLVMGRDFSDRDRVDSPRVVIVSEAFVRRVFPHSNPIGKRLGIPRYQGDNTYSEIIGVAKDIKYRRLAESPLIYLYVPLLQQYQSSATLFVRGDGANASAFASPVEREVRLLDRNLPVFGMTLLSERLQESLAPQRSAATTLGLFGLLALVLASVGLYGVLAYSVAQRQHEIGIRMALGAQPSDVLALVVKQGMSLTGSGVAIGLLTAFISTRLIATELYGVSPIDPITLIATSLLLMAVALLACYLPARRAIRVDPLIALRHE